MTNTNKTVTLWLLVGCLWLAFFVRVWGLNEAAIWEDEFITAFDVSRPGLWATIQSLTRYGEQLPAYYVIQYLLPFGPYENPFVLRIPSVLFSMLALALMIRAGGGLGLQANLVLLLALVFAIHPEFIRFSRSARAYPLLMALTLASSLVFLSLVGGKPTAWKWFLWMAFSSLAFLTHLIGLTMMGPQALIILLMWWQGSVGWRFVGRGALVMGGACLPVILWAIWAVRPTSSLGSWIPAITWQRVGEVLHQLMLGPPAHELASVLALGGVGVILLTFRTAKKPIHRLYWFAFASIPLLFVAGVALWVRPMWELRYVIYTLPAVMLTGAVSLSLAPVRVRWGVASLLVLLMFRGTMTQLVYTQFAFYSYDLRPFLQRVDEVIQPGDGLYIDIWGYPELIYKDYLTHEIWEDVYGPNDIGTTISAQVTTIDDMKYDRMWLIGKLGTFWPQRYHPNLHYVWADNHFVLWRYDVVPLDAPNADLLADFSPFWFAGNFQKVELSERCATLPAQKQWVSIPHEGGPPSVAPQQLSLHYTIDQDSENYDDLIVWMVASDGHYYAASVDTTWDTIRIARDIGNGWEETQRDKRPLATGQPYTLRLTLDSGTLYVDHNNERVLAQHGLAPSGRIVLLKPPQSEVCLRDITITNPGANDRLSNHERSNRYDP
jgi:hypothetical protein